MILCSICMMTIILYFIVARNVSSPILWTSHHARLQQISSIQNGNINWVLLPGGPGDGSEYLRSLAMALKLPGTTWLLDLPGNGSNQIKSQKVNFNQWPEDLVEAVAKLPNVVLIAHSFGGMLALSSPKLQQHLKGIILISTAPDNSFQKSSEQLAKRINIPDFNAEKKYYLEQHHDDAGLKYVNIAIAKNYYFTPDFVEQGTQLIKNMSYSHLAFDWGLQQFMPNYKARWVPEKIPVLILAGEKDVLIPMNVFPSNPAFHRPNIQITIIANAGHYLWVDNAQDTVTEIRNFYQQFLD